jgi:hypothetical protein
MISRHLPLSRGVAAGLLKTRQECPRRMIKNLAEHDENA